MTEPCRFCLETDVTPSNPLVSPCSCIGSVKYIHQKCLYRWILIEPSTKKMNCSICSGRFQLTDPIEVIPQKNTISLVLLWNPLLIMICLQYMKMFYYFNNPNPLINAIFNKVFETQLAFHVIYACLFVINARITRKESYWTISRGRCAGMAIYHLAALSLTWSGSMTASYFMGYYTYLFWKIHCDTLAQSNKLLLDDLA